MDSVKRVAAIAKAVALTALCIGGSSALAASAPDFTQFGFPTVIGQASVQANQASTLTVGDLSVSIPAGAFARNVTFELLQGPLSAFQMNAPAGQTPVVDFAFKVLDPQSHRIIGKFLKPVVVAYTNPAISQMSQYWDISTDGAYLPNPKPPIIVRHTLRHGNLGAPVGWLITVPSKPIAGATQPVTGIPLTGLLLLGFTLATAGGLLFLLRRRLS